MSATYCRSPLALAVVLAAAASLLHTPVGAQQVTLRVLDAETRQPLQGVLAELVRGGTTVASATSGADGRLTVEGSTGSYALMLSALGFETRRVDGVSVGSGVLAIGELLLTSRAFALNPVVVTASKTTEKALDAPASVHTVGVREVEERVALSAVDYLNEVPGVDVVQSGLARSSVAIRGFNTAFSNKLMVLTDNRWSSIPSLRFNAFNMLSAVEQDIERVEVVLGPGSALYGPNTANGVMHIITRSPFDYQGTAASVTTGTRSIFQSSFRHAGTAGERVGFKISGVYFRGNEWEHTDPVEAANRAAAIEGGASETGLLIGLRDFEAERYAGDGRVDIRLDGGGLLSLSSGFSMTRSSVEQVQTNVAQVKGWSNTHAQARFSRDRLFAQAYINLTNAGDTYLLRSGVPLIDKSYLLVGQLQHGADVGERQSFTYGADLTRTVPRTEGTIHGVNEDSDAMFETGAYLQSETSLTARVDLVAAGRVDYHDLLDETVFSPRAALVLTPADGHNLRLTYNRSFQLPSSAELSVDLVSSPTLGGLPFAVRVAGIAGDGYTFRRDCAGGLCMRSAFTPPALGGASQQLPLDATLMWDAAVQVLGAANPQAAALLGLMVAPTSASVGTVMRLLNPSTGSFDVVSDVADVPPPTTATTTMFEVGYKGLIDDRLFLGIDVYRAEVKNLISPIFVLTPSVFLDAQGVGAHLASEAARLGLPLDAQTIASMTAGLASIPLATVTPENNPGGGADLLLTSRNFGEVTYWGADVAVSLKANEHWSVSGSYSFMSEDLFVGVGGLRDVAMNGPKSKGSLSVRYGDERAGFSAETRARFVRSFPYSSGLWVGDVDGYELMDASLSYDLPFSPGTSVALSASNVLDKAHRQGVGVPTLGRLLMLRVSRSF